MGAATAAAGVATKTITGALVGTVTVGGTAALASRPARLGAFTVVLGAATQVALTGATTNLTSGATRVLTATIQDATGNTVTTDNTTVITFAKQSGAGTVTGTGTAIASAGVATKTITGAPRRFGHHGGDRSRPHHRHARRLHGRPRGGGPDRADQRHHQPHLRRHPRAHGDDPGCRRQHGHRRQHDGVTFAKQSGAGTVTGTGNCHRHRRRRHQDDHRPARRLRHDGSHRSRTHHRHARRIHGRPRGGGPDRR